MNSKVSIASFSISAFWDGVLCFGTGLVVVVEAVMEDGVADWRDNWGCESGDVSRMATVEVVVWVDETEYPPSANDSFRGW